MFKVNLCMAWLLLHIYLEFSGGRHCLHNFLYIRLRLLASDRLECNQASEDKAAHAGEESDGLIDRSVAVWALNPQIMSSSEFQT